MTAPQRKFEVVDCEQGSVEWRLARAGRVTGSCADLVASQPLPSGGETAGKKDYRLQLAVERITGIPQESEFQNKHTRRGSEIEPLARVEVELATGITFIESGFLRHMEKMIGVSLDGHTKDFRTTLELKCPKSTTHINYLRANKLPPAYRWQVIHGIYISGAQQCIFASYDERMPDGLNLLIVEVFAKDLPIEEYGRALDEFLLSVDAECERLKEMQRKRGVR